mmetsp:Transcript_1887/g.11365  ORF Transcript_1887/g.11365 Transcript_1887/m.11365 type:complete len:463 (-) Transcript_1887:1550-2938(-)
MCSCDASTTASCGHEEGECLLAWRTPNAFVAGTVPIAARRRRRRPCASEAARTSGSEAWKRACATAGRSSTCSRASWLWDGWSWRRARCVVATTARRWNPTHDRNEWEGIAATNVHVAWTCDERRSANPKRSTRLTRTWTTTMRREAPRHVPFVRRAIPHARFTLANATGTRKTSDGTAPSVPKANARIQTDHGRQIEANQSIRVPIRGDHSFHPSTQPIQLPGPKRAQAGRGRGTRPPRRHGRDERRCRRHAIKKDFRARARETSPRGPSGERNDVAQEVPRQTAPRLRNRAGTVRGEFCPILLHPGGRRDRELTSPLHLEDPAGTHPKQARGHGSMGDAEDVLQRGLDGIRHGSVVRTRRRRGRERDGDVPGVLSPHTPPRSRGRSYGLQGSVPGSPCRGPLRALFLLGWAPKPAPAEKGHSTVTCSRLACPNGHHRRNPVSERDGTRASRVYAGPAPQR